jgi:hypothetical protein
VVWRHPDPSFISQATTLTFIGPPGLDQTMLAIATRHVKLGPTAVAGIEQFDFRLVAGYYE